MLGLQNKFKVKPNPLALEDKAKEMVPTDSFAKQHIIAWYESKISEFKQNLLVADNEQQVVLKASIYAYEVKLEQVMNGNIEQRFNEDYVKEFNCWLQGKSRYNIPPKARYSNDERIKRANTPWGTLPLRGPSIIQYLYQFIDAKFDFEKKLTSLKMVPPTDIKSAWLYFKYIVCPGGTWLQDEFHRDFNWWVDATYKDGPVDSTGKKLEKPTPVQSEAQRISPLSAGDPGEICYIDEFDIGGEYNLSHNKNTRQTEIIKMKRVDKQTEEDQPDYPTEEDLESEIDDPKKRKKTKSEEKPKYKGLYDSKELFEQSMTNILREGLTKSGKEAVQPMLNEIREHFDKLNETLSKKSYSESAGHLTQLITKMDSIAGTVNNISTNNTSNTLNQNLQQNLVQIDTSLRNELRDSLEKDRIANNNKIEKLMGLYGQQMDFTKTHLAGINTTLTTHMSALAQQQTNVMSNILSELKKTDPNSQKENYKNLTDKLGEIALQNSEISRLMIGNHETQKKNLEEKIDKLYAEKVLSDEKANNKISSLATENNKISSQLSLIEANRLQLEANLGAKDIQLGKLQRQLTKLENTMKIQKNNANIADELKAVRLQKSQLEADMHARLEEYKTSFGNQLNQALTTTEQAITENKNLKGLLEQNSQVISGYEEKIKMAQQRFMEMNQEAESLKTAGISLQKEGIEKLAAYEAERQRLERDVALYNQSLTEATNANNLLLQAQQQQRPQRNRQTYMQEFGDQLKMLFQSQEESIRTHRENQRKIQSSQLENIDEDIALIAQSEEYELENLHKDNERTHKMIDSSIATRLPIPSSNNSVVNEDNYADHLRNFNNFLDERKMTEKFSAGTSQETILKELKKWVEANPSDTKAAEIYKNTQAAYDIIEAKQNRVKESNIELSYIPNPLKNTKDFDEKTTKEILQDAPQHLAIAYERIRTNYEDLPENEIRNLEITFLMQIQKTMNDYVPNRNLTTSQKLNEEIEDDEAYSMEPPSDNPYSSYLLKHNEQIMNGDLGSETMKTLMDIYDVLNTNSGYYKPSVIKNISHHLFEENDIPRGKILDPSLSVEQNRIYNLLGDFKQDVNTLLTFLSQVQSTAVSGAVHNPYDLLSNFYNDNLSQEETQRKLDRIGKAYRIAPVEKHSMTHAEKEEKTTKMKKFLDTLLIGDNSFAMVQTALFEDVYSSMIQDEEEKKEYLEQEEETRPMKKRKEQFKNIMSVVKSKL